jgi:hypothetical protein
MIEITAIHLSGPAKHEHIASLQWRNVQTGATGQSSRQQIVQWLEESKANQAVVISNDARAYVGIQRHGDGSPYLRTHADGKWNDNLLALPRF